MSLSSTVICENQYVLVGNYCTLVCRSTINEPVQWIYLYSRTSSQYTIFRHGDITEQYTDQFTIQVNDTTRDYNLVLFNARLNNIGWYVCFEDEGIGKKHMIRLPV